MSFWVFLQNNVMYVRSKTLDSPWHLTCIPQIVSTFAHRWLPDASIDTELLQLTVTVTLSMCYTHITCNVSLVSPCSLVFKSFICFIKDAKKAIFIVIHCFWWLQQEVYFFWRDNFAWQKTKCLAMYLATAKPSNCNKTKLIARFRLLTLLRSNRMWRQVSYNYIYLSSYVTVLEMFIAPSVVTHSSWFHWRLN
jgi:hypothetical protein